MTVINIRGENVDQTWRDVEVAEKTRSLDSVILSFASLKEHIETLDQKSLSRIGVRLTVNDEIGEIADHARHIGLIDLVFPNFKDGRPFSTAVTVRRDYGFSGDLRASGDILPDQALFLARCGFSTIVVPVQFPVKQFKTSLGAYTIAYQAAVDSNVSQVRDLRRSAVEVVAE
ncbi:MAG: DUF934 domain-containing protein [Rhodospirillales bacterium]|jgi:uncharacterized protein (DUF934 family)